MKMKYEVPAIEALNVEDTACEDGNTFFGGAIVLKRNCGGWGTLSNFHITGPELCDCPPLGQDS